MPPRPFPYALGIGTDICHVPRIQRLILRHDDGGIERFGSKIFNEFERKFFNTKLSRYKAARAAAVLEPNGHGGASSTETLPDAQDVERSTPLIAFARWIAGRYSFFMRLRCGCECLLDLQYLDLPPKKLPSKQYPIAGYSTMMSPSLSPTKALERNHMPGSSLLRD